MVDDVFEWCDTKWRIGRLWGKANPSVDHNCHHSNKAVDNMEGITLALDIVYEPKFFEDLKQTKEYGVGYITSVEEYKYGEFHFEYSLPKGRNLCPSIWFNRMMNLPPEMYVMKGNTGSMRRDYNAIPLVNSIAPFMYYGTERRNSVYKMGILNGKFTWKNYNRMDSICKCDFIWEPDRIRVYYNGHKVGDCKNRDILSGFDKPMMLHMNTYVKSNFTYLDYMDYQNNGRPMLIYDYKYNC